MTNGEKIKQIFPGLHIDEGELEVYMWTTAHDAIDMPLEWWEAEYKEPDYIADVGKKIEPTPNDCETCIHNKGVLECDMYGCKYESTTKNCRSCKNFGSHHGICEICKDNKCWTEIEPTADNDSAVDCIVDVLGSYTDLDIPYKREIAENILTKLPSVTPQEPKTGHWIWCVGSHKCSNCEEYTCFSHKELLRYCPNCGAKMVEPQESEV